MSGILLYKVQQLLISAGFGSILLYVVQLLYAYRVQQVTNSG